MKTSSKKWQKIRKIKGLRQFVTWYPRHVSENPGYKETLRKFFSEYVRTLRKCRGLTQEEMAEKLRISGRAYSDLERGIYCFSTVALVFLLLMLEEGEIKELLSPLLDEIEKVEGRGVVE